MSAREEANNVHNPRGSLLVVAHHAIEDASPSSHCALVRELVREALRCALRSSGTGSEPDATTIHLIRRACDAAHQNGLRAEQMVVVMKDAWRDLTTVRVSTGHDGRSVLDSVITLCISEYYSHSPRP